MKTVELVFEYTQSEYVKAEKQYLFARKIITKMSVVILAIFLLFSLGYLFLSSFSAISVIAFGVALITILAGCILYFYIPIYKFKQTSKYHEEYTLIFSKGGIHFKTPTIDSQLKWSVYSEMWESNDFYFLIQTPQLYTLIPKRVFANHGIEQSFENIALSNLKCAKRIL